MTGIEKTDDMKIEDLAGETIFASVQDEKLTEKERELVGILKPGGFVLFSHNLVNMGNARSFCEELTSIVLSGRGRRPFIAVDQEGGQVIRLPRPASHIPSMMAIGATRDPLNAFRVALIVSIELRAIGMNMNFAPVLDINTNPDNPVIGTRSFGENPELVTKFGSKYIEGLKQGKILSVAKHFPGHGDTSIDSHSALPIVEHGLERLESVEMKPFYSAIKHDVDGIMVSHVAVPSVDPSGLPSSLSEKVVSGILRNRAAFQGLIITDSLGMKAVSDEYDIEEASTKAIEAGNDMILGCSSLDKALDVRTAIVRRARKDSSFLRRLKSSVRRILHLKDTKLGNFRKPTTSVIGCQSHYKEIQRIVERSVSTVWNQGALALRANSRICFVIPSDVSAYSQMIKEAISKHFAGIDKRIFEQLDPNFRESALLSRSIDFDAFVAFSIDLHKKQLQAEFLGKLIKNLPNTMVIAINSPYDIRRLPPPRAYIATHSPDPFSIEFAIRSLSAMPNRKKEQAFRFVDRPISFKADSRG